MEHAFINPNFELCKNLKKIRESHNETTKDLADYINIPQNLYENIEQGAISPTFNVLVNFATHYHCSMADLYPYYPMTL